MGVKGRYRLLQAFFWMSTVIIWGYGIAYLKEFGFSAGKLGILFAVASLLAAILQPAAGRLADRSRRFHWKLLFTGVIGILLVLLLSLLLVKNNIYIALVFGAYSLIMNIALGLMNVACFYYEHKGTKMNFGVARGIGSFAYACLSLLLGQLIAPLGMQIILYSGIAMTAVLFLLVLSLPYDGPLEQQEKKTASGGTKNILAFFKKYPAFILMVGACSLFLTFQIMTSCYMVMIVESVGGDSGSLGIVLFLAALLEIPVMFLTGRLVKRFRSYWLITLAGAVYALRGILYFFATNVTAVFLIQLLQPLSYALVVSVQVYFSDECMEVEDLATGQTFMGTSQAAGSMLGYFFGGLVIQNAGIKPMLLFTSVLAMAGTGLAVVSSLMRRAKEHRTPA